MDDPIVLFSGGLDVELHEEGISEFLSGNLTIVVGVSLIDDESGHVAPVLVSFLESSGHTGSVVLLLLLCLSTFRAVVEGLHLVSLLSVGGVQSHPALDGDGVSGTGADVRVGFVDGSHVLVSLAKLGSGIIAGEKEGPRVVETGGENTSHGIDTLDHVLGEILSNAFV